MSGCVGVGVGLGVGVGIVLNKLFEIFESFDIDNLMLLFDCSCI